jgi:hypothetical protein
MPLYTCCIVNKKLIKTLAAPHLRWMPSLEFPCKVQLVVKTGWLV